ncbi:MAG: Hsp20/alpha crystallin family protein [Spirochaetales bacterium]|nr:Hsp20/alpha crystallin family protein [Spirochaetales bacterium]
MNYMVSRNRVNDMDRIFNSFFNWNETPAAAAARVPAVDITESEKGYEIFAELPGFSEDELNLQVKDNLLTITAEKMEEAKKEEKDEKDEVRYLKRERSLRSFKRSFYLPKDATSENIEAVFKDGLLTLSIAKKEEAKPLAIKVRTK